MGFVCEAWTRRQILYLSSMPVKRIIPYSEGVYFITFTCYQWLPLIEQTNSYEIVYNWFDHITGRGHYITGYVIMPNHVHALIGFRRTDQSINTIVGNGKRFMAYEIVKRLEKQNQSELLQQLQQAVEIKDRLRNKLHEIWEDSFDWKECTSETFIKQKLDYMHNNPCKGKWDLAVSPSDYPHSSARFYICNEHSNYKVTSYAELFDIDLTKKIF
jgi:REP element-mobilizing transposase RayT